MAFYVRVLTVKNSIKHMLDLGKVTGNTGKIEENECSGYSKNYFVSSSVDYRHRAGTSQYFLLSSEIIQNNCNFGHHLS